MTIPFFEFRFSDKHKQELDAAQKRVFDAKEFINGKEVQKLEEEISDYLEVPYSIAVGNGYDALFIALKLISESPLNVLMQANAYPATLNAVLNAGHNVVFADIDFINDGFAELKNDFLERNKIDLLLAIHYFGSTSKILKNLPNSVELMEDFSQAFGSSLDKKYCGSFGEINAASLYPTKNLGAFGDAGIITTRDIELYQKARKFRNYGESKYNDNRLIGVNSRLDEVQAAFLRVNLKRLSGIIQEKRTIAKFYFEELKDIEGLTLPVSDPIEDSFHQFTIKTGRRDELKEYLEKSGISTKIHYPNPLFEQIAYQNLDFTTIDKQKVSKWHNSILSLPSFNGIKQSELDYIVAKIKSFYN